MAIVYCGKILGKLKDGSSHVFSLDVIQRYNRDVPANFEHAKTRFRRRMRNVIERRYCTHLENAIVYATNGRDVRGWIFNPDDQRWSPIAMVEDGDISDVLTLVSSRGLNSDEISEIK